MTHLLSYECFHCSERISFLMLYSKFTCVRRKYDVWIQTFCDSCIFSVHSIKNKHAYTRLPITRMQNRDQYRKSIRWVSGLAVEESKCIHSVEFIELFSLNCIYVNYKNVILSNIHWFFRTWTSSTYGHVLSQIFNRFHLGCVFRRRN